MNRVIISGGGTGGHIFPAIAIADEIQRRYPHCEILFVGAQGKMEMEKVPQAGYRIVGLPIAGLQRKLALSNFALPFKLLKSLWMARGIIKEFNPDAVIGVGGYASGPTLKMAAMLGKPTFLQEQNGFAGKTNKLLAQKAKAICTAYPNMERFFPSEKIVLTGNPVRENIKQIASVSRIDALAHFGLESTKKTILIIGGSLGARTLNQAMKSGVMKLLSEGNQVIWQTGKYYFEGLQQEVEKHPSLVLTQFIGRMDFAYTAADVIISRAGAISISELCLVGKPLILVPSPNVAEDHQTHNAMALVNAGAALLVKDQDAGAQLIDTAMHLMKDEKAQEQMMSCVKKLAKPNATEDIVNVIESKL